MWSYSTRGTCLHRTVTGQPSDESDDLCGLWWPPDSQVTELFNRDNRNPETWNIPDVYGRVQRAGEGKNNTTCTFRRSRARFSKLSCALPERLRSAVRTKTPFPGPLSAPSMGVKWGTIGVREVRRLKEQGA